MDAEDDRTQIDPRANPWAMLAALPLFSGLPKSIVDQAVAELVGQRLQSVGAARGRDDGGAGRVQHPREPVTQAAGRPRDDGHPVVEAEGRGEIDGGHAAKPRLAP